MPDDATTSDGRTVLHAPLTLEYPFRRTTGPVIGAFFTGLREGRFVGIRDRSGRVVCPPVEYDPQDGSPLTELVPVGDEGEVVTWSWNERIREGQPLDHPFAWAMIRLDGADTPILHAVDAARSAMSAGMRVRARFADERIGAYEDLACFEPVG
jgi:uncharacterized OB-fold protein